MRSSGSSLQQPGRSGNRVGGPRHGWAPLSAGKSARVEKGLLLGSRAAAHDRVAMGKAPKSADYLGMLLCIARKFFFAVAARQLKAVLLVGQIFRMHERQIEKFALRMRDFPIKAASERALGHGARHGVAVVAAPLPAEHVARELIEHDNERQCRFRRFFPGPELAACGSFPDRKKARRDFLIERRVLLEPLVRS